MLKRLVSSPVGLAAIALALLAGGFVIGMRVADRKAEEDVHTLMLAQATLQLTQTTDLATALRNGMADPALERIETHIDSAIIDMSHHYTPARDIGGRASRALGVARAYRDAHPEHFQRSVLRDMVEPALEKLPR